MRNILFLRITLILLIIFDIDMSIQAQKMPDAANDLYNKFTTAIQNNDVKGMEKCFSKASTIELKNITLSMGSRYPEDAVFFFQFGLIELKDLRYIKYKKDGPTINAYYINTVNNVDVAIITLRLLEEDGALKLIRMDRRDSRDFVINLNNKDYSFFDLPEFKPDGVAPTIPKPVENIDIPGKYDVVAYGYKVKLTMNGFYQDEVINAAKMGVIIGGVKRGENILEISVEKMDPTEKDNPAVAIKTIVNDQEKDVFVIYEEMSGTITRTFTVE
jgi:hypothetical protein